MGRRFAAARSIALDISPLRDSVPYRALYFGQLVSLFGSNMRLVAVAWQVFQLTESTVAVGLIGLVEVVPLIAFSIWGGAVADRTDRRALLVKMQLGLMASSVALVVVSLQQDPSVLWIYALVAVSSALKAIDGPTRSAMIPSLVAEGKLAAAMALRQVLFQVTQIAGPAVGGLLIAGFGNGDGSGVIWVYAFDALTFTAALIALRWVPPSPPLRNEGEMPAPTLEAIREGLSFALRNPVVLSIFVIDLVAMIFGSPRSVFPALAQETFGMGAGGVGLLYSAPAAGALVGALTTGWVTRIERQGLAVIIAVFGWGVAIAAAGATVFSVGLTVVFLALAGWADVVSAIFRGTMLQEVTPDALRGRISAVNIMVVTGGPRIGDFEAGLLAAATGAPASILLGGLACVVGTAVVAVRFPSLSAYRARAIVDGTSDAPRE